MSSHPLEPGLCLNAEPGADPDRLCRLRETYGFAVCDEHASPEFRLVLTAQRLELRQSGQAAPGPVFVDFTGGPLAHRRGFGGGRGQPLARAVGISPGYSPTVFDATAGLGRDAFVLASIGCRITLCERSAALVALLRDAIGRAQADPDVAAIAARMDVQWTDARDWLAALPEPHWPDVIYLDPMYPPGRSSALVRKEMRAVQRLVGPDVDSAPLLESALTRAKRRVVVKRPGAAAWLHGRKPSTCIQSKKTRYDVYVCM
jgi:16S rRNA (guanine1516-N2)-methyltransferase